MESRPVADIFSRFPNSNWGNPSPEARVPVRECDWLVREIRPCASKDRTRRRRRLEEVRAQAKPGCVLKAADHINPLRVRKGEETTRAEISPEAVLEPSSPRTNKTKPSPPKKNSSSTCSTCSLSLRRRAARRASRRVHGDRHRLPLQAHAARTCCIRWAGTRSACPPSSTPSKPARIRASPPQKNIDTFRRQLKMLGFSYDWDREFATTDPDYFRWTQWIFLQIFDTWYDADLQWTGPDGMKNTAAGRPIAELPIPAEVETRAQEAVRRLSGSSTGWPISTRPPSTGARAGDRAGQRRSHRRQERTRRPSRRPHAAAAVDAADHRLCRPPRRRSRPARTGPSRSSSCSATGSAGARGRRSTFHRS